jgi:putative transposase
MMVKAIRTTGLWIKERMVRTSLTDRTTGSFFTGLGRTRSKMWGSFLRILAYKAEEAGCRFEKVDPRHTSVNCSCCGTAIPKTLATRIHRCHVCGLILDRDHNAAINILQRSTAGTAESYAWGELALSGPSLNQEAMLLAAW